MSGWVKLHRKLLDNPIFQDSSLVHVFLYCLLKANHEPRRFMFNGQEMLIEAGQFIAGRKEASKALKFKSKMWDRKLHILRNVGILTINPTNKFSVIHIVKWADYQVNDQDNDQQMTNKRPTNDHKQEVYKNDKKYIYPFDDIWAKYPNRDGKGAAERHFNKTVKTEQEWLDIQKALDNYLQTEKVKNGFIKNGSTWFNQWRDFVDWTSPEKQKETEKQKELKEAQDRYFKHKESQKAAQ